VISYTTSSWLSLSSGARHAATSTSIPIESSLRTNSTSHDNFFSLGLLARARCSHLRSGPRLLHQFHCCLLQSDLMVSAPDRVGPDVVCSSRIASPRAAYLRQIRAWAFIGSMPGQQRKQGHKLLYGDAKRQNSYATTLYFLLRFSQYLSF
jgi:hypothetical protein